ncbi:glycosyltransferase family 15 protein [Suhomyces tanzawaensis NRRL Y-17324]|uniref:Glycosyltransferase family 15 protein n=1 Tax=Suhomyces tanzawaensis NRRL Y-17324 TaxID=984487 RepID=A0A1E4SPT3_9ASCO|nr:glycosyltransferase family 15 protein [Suhomyces tanzawaensis NRRL Y-17324]ODV81523.1 glycosyltransferase family 15 protein [Suhomyces tanzawaensis NRRL Y-17324]
MSPRSNARIVRFGVFALILIGCGYILSRGSTYPVVPTTPVVPVTPNANQQVPAAAKPKAAAAVPAAQDKIKATFVSLARNSDLYSLLGSIRQVEDRFNRKFEYDWVFLNDQPFNEEFIAETTALVSGKTKYGLIPKEQWSYPEWIDQEKAALAREAMKEKKVIYGDSVPYRHMCRYESGFFWRHELMAEYEYYWRVEPDIKIYCDIDYDIFKWMKDNNKDYSFTISLPEYEATIPTLWKTTKEFIEQNKQYVAENNLLQWISSDNGETYNGCHFWSNFEIANLNFWRGEAYTKYFEFLDKAGGFFYERWGDAPVHSIAVALFMNKDKVHFFEDVGYNHVPFHNCPVDPEVRKQKNCACNPNEDFTWKGYSCTSKFYTLTDKKRMKGWEKFAD